MIKYKDKEYEVKPYSIDTGMAYDLYIEPLRNAYLLDFAGLLDEDYLQSYYTRISEQQEIVDSFEPELNDEQKASLKMHTERLDAIKNEFKQDAKAQAIEKQLDKLKELALIQTLGNKPQVKKFFEKVLTGDLAAITYEGEDYYIFGTEVLTAFFLELTKTLRQKMSSSENTAM